MWPDSAVYSIAGKVLERNKWRVHLDVAKSVDAILEGKEPPAQLREVKC